MLQMIVEGILVAWLVTVTVVALKFLWWVVSPLPDSEVRVVELPEGTVELSDASAYKVTAVRYHSKEVERLAASPLEDIEEAYVRIHEQAHKEKS